MEELVDLYRNNASANERVFALAQDVEAGLEADAPGTRNMVKGTLAHLARVEYVYLTMIQGKPRESVGSREDTKRMTWPGCAAISRFVRAIETATPDVLARRLEIAVNFPVTARDRLLQVLTHSSRRRSQVLSWLSAQGVPTPDLDYVVMLGVQHGSSE
jgi:uncharacterized damage-inducible protein DinB